MSDQVNDAMTAADSKGFGGIPAGLSARWTVLFELARSDFRAKYLGSYLGMVWAFLNPVVYIFMLWFVFQVGLNSRPMGQYPFILWMLTGIVPWFFFSECLGNATNAIVENGFAVKKMVFEVALLPVIKILSSLVIHLFFVAVIFVMLFAYGHRPNLYNLQVLYFLFAAIALLLGLSLLTSAVMVFLRDLGHLVHMALQFLFWMTPIFWSPSILPARLHILLKLNPVYYLVEGYRQAFLYNVWFWEGHHLWTIYFWGVTVTLLVVGGIMFRMLRPHFADVL